MQEEIDLLIAQGLAPTLAEMFVTRQAPGCKTDRELFAGHVNGSQFAGNPARGDFYKRIAKEDGINITGKVYKAQLAEYPGDPEAWVADSTDIRRVCESRGYSCEGDVTVKGPGIREEPKPGPKLAPDIVDRIVLDKVKADPGLKAKPLPELREMVIDKHGPQSSTTGNADKLARLAGQA